MASRALLFGTFPRKHAHLPDDVLLHIGYVEYIDLPHIISNFSRYSYSVNMYAFRFLNGICLFCTLCSRIV